MHRFRLLVTLPLALTLAACHSSSRAANTAQVLPATPLWEVPRLTLLIVTPTDLRASSPDRVWISDTTHNAVFRIDSPKQEYLRFGFEDEPPKELVKPLRLAPSPTGGLFVYDAGTHEVDLYTEDANFLWGFPLEFTPELMTATRDPYGLAFVVAKAVSDSAAELLVLQTDMKGEGRDTLLDDRHGPPALQDLVAGYRDVYLAPSESGFWVWWRTVPDTVFEVSAAGPGRRIVLRDHDVEGLLSDIPRQLVWVMHPDSAVYAYDAYDVSPAGGPTGAFLGTRTTPADMQPIDAVDGALIGWARVNPVREFAPRAYDMRVAEFPARPTPAPTAAPDTAGSRWSRPGG